MTDQQIHDTWAEIQAAPSHYAAAEAAAKCAVMAPDGTLYFGQLMVTHSMLALVDELRNQTGEAS